MSLKHEEYFYHQAEKEAKHTATSQYESDHWKDYWWVMIYEMLISKGIEHRPSEKMHHLSFKWNAHILFRTSPRGGLCTNYHPRDDNSDSWNFLIKYWASDPKLHYGNFSIVLSHYKEARSVEILCEKLSFILPIFSHGFLPPKSQGIFLPSLFTSLCFGGKSETKEDGCSLSGIKSLCPLKAPGNNRWNKQSHEPCAFISYVSNNLKSTTFPSGKILASTIGSKVL